MHPLLTGKEVAVGLRAFFVQFWGSSPFRRGLVPRSPGGRWMGSVFVRANAYCCLPLLCGLNPVDPTGISTTRIWAVSLIKDWVKGGLFVQPLRGTRPSQYHHSSHPVGVGQVGR